MDQKANISIILFQLRELYVHLHPLDDLALFLWGLIDDYFPSEDPDGYFWWHATGLSLARMLSKAGYDIEPQIRQLLFYRFYVVPGLGPGPDAHGKPQSWESFMTDSHTPIEFSWDWGCGKDKPTVRYAIEPIGFNAGTSRDPFNEHAADGMIRELRSVFPNVDLEWFRHFSRTLLFFQNVLTPLYHPFAASARPITRLGFRHALTKAILRPLSITRIKRAAGLSPGNLPFPTPASSDTPTSEASHRSHSFLAFDVHSKSVTVKAYFIPTLASQLKTSLFFASIQALGSSFPCLTILYTYLSDHPTGSTLKPEILSVDCDSSCDKRIKIYLRTNLTSLNSVRSIMTLDGLLISSDANFEQGLLEVEKLWKLVLGVKSLGGDDELDACGHRTGGLLYYFDMREGQKLPAVKLYIPVRHYGSGDEAVQRGLGVYLRERGQGFWFERFEQAMKGISYALDLVLRSRLTRHRDTKRGKNIYTYITCVIKRGELRVTSYISPEVYK